MQLAGKVAVITGAASGIGLASARLFGQEGASVLLGDVDEEEGRRAAEEIEGAAKPPSCGRTSPPGQTWSGW